MRHRELQSVIALIVLIACHDEKPSPHTYGSPPPPPARVPGTSAAVTTPELPIGTMGPGAKLLSVSDAATGTPVALGSITDSVDILTLVAFGPNSEPWRNGGHVELVMRGVSMDTTLVLRLDAPAPSVVAHAFRVARLKIGRYTGVVRLRASTGSVIAESTPLYLEVVGR